MTEDEAEAALLALGGVLEWHLWIEHPLDDKLSDKYKELMKGIVEFAITVNHDAIGQYVVGLKQWCFLWHRYTARYLSVEPRGVEQAPHQYKHLATAKAACERHHATGRWD